MPAFRVCVLMPTYGKHGKIYQPKAISKDAIAVLPHGKQSFSVCNGLVGKELLTLYHNEQELNDLSSAPQKGVDNFRKYVIGLSEQEDSHLSRIQNYNRL